MAETVPKSEILEVPIDAIKPGLNVRKDPCEKTLPALGDSLAVAQHHPIILDPDFILVDGWRRFLAARLRGLKTLKAIITTKRVSEMSETDLRLTQISIAHHTANLTGYELYEACYALLQLNLWSAKTLAERLHISPSLMTRVLSASKCCREVRDAFRDRKIGIGTVYSLSKFPEDRQAEYLAMKLAGASRDSLERARLRRSPKKRNGSISKGARFTIVLANGMTVVISGEQLSMEDLIQATADLNKEAKRGLEQNFDLKTLEVVLRRRSRGEQ